MDQTAFRLLDTGLLPAADNMAVDEVILEEVASGNSPPTLRFLRFDPPAALVGRHQSVGREIRRDFCRDNGIDINRRITGGGAIYFQSSALGWELFGSSGHPVFKGRFEDVLTRICETAADAISALGPPARFRPRNDIEVDGRKISGTGGVAVTGGYMFQGTLLIKNEIELFLKSLRVPVEKLKKREIESLQQRVCFLDDLLDPIPEISDVKAAFVRVFEKQLDISLRPGGLTEREVEGLKSRRPYYSSPDWIRQKEKGVDASSGFWSLYQTPAGTFRIHLWTEPGGRRIRRMLITGDFFCRPDRLVMDLEAAMAGLKADPDLAEETVTQFLEHADGEFIGIELHEVARALSMAVRRLKLAEWRLSDDEINEIFLVNMAPEDAAAERPDWLLLPYCSKKIDCGYRKIPECIQCGECDFDRMYDFGRARGLEPVSVQSFEHLMEVLERITAHGGDRFFVGSCCEAFFAKHQREMESTGARGVLVNLDSTTCYDLGKGMEAYVGQFDNQTEMNCDLIEKVVDRLEGR